MSQTIWTKIRKSEFTQWVKQNPKLIILSIIVAIGSFFVIPIIFIFGAVAVIEKEMLRALIEAEATILGFFGLIVVYALTSLDDRQDRWEKIWLDLTEKGKHTEVVLPAVMLGKFYGVKAVTKDEICRLTILNINKQRRKTVYSALYTGVLLFGSLLTSILALGIPIGEWSFYLSSFSIMLLFVSIGEILWTIYDLAKS